MAAKPKMVRPSRAKAHPPKAPVIDNCRIWATIAKLKALSRGYPKTSKPATAESSKTPMAPGEEGMAAPKAITPDTNSETRILSCIPNIFNKKKLYDELKQMIDSLKLKYEDSDLYYEFDEHGFNIVLDTIEYCNTQHEIETNEQIYEPGSPIGWIWRSFWFEPVDLRVRVYNLDKIRSLE